jgi:hypothetical protein
MGKINCTPKPSMLRAIQNQSWNVAGALAELVDNSLGSKRGDARNVIITYEPRHRIIEVLDDGRGANDIGDLFRLGETVGRGVGDIGIFGYGGKYANLWLASKVSVWNLVDGQVQRETVIWNDWFEVKSFEDCNVDNDWRVATPSNVPADLFGCKHGVLIRLHLLPGRTFRAPAVIRELSRLYSTGLRNGRNITWRTRRANGEIEDSQLLVDPYAKMFTERTRGKTFNLVIEHGGRHLPVHGQVSYDENTPMSESKVHIGFGHRVLMSTADCFQSEDGEEKYAGVGVSGWLDLGQAWLEHDYISTTKDSIHHRPLYEALMRHVFEAIKPILQESENRAFTMQFDDIAIGVERALNDKSGDLRIKVGTVWKKLTNEGGGGPGIDEPGSGLKESPTAPEVEEPGGDGDVAEKESERLFQVGIVRENDKALDGALCRATIQSGTKACDVYVSVNSDHGVVQEALRSRPPKRDLLNLMIVDEIGRTVTEDVIKKLFHPKLASDICDIQDQIQRSRVIARRLVDRVIVQDEAA